MHTANRRRGEWKGVVIARRKIKEFWMSSPRHRSAPRVEKVRFGTFEKQAMVFFPAFFEQGKRGVAFQGLSDFIGAGKFVEEAGRREKPLQFAFVSVPPPPTPFPKGCQTESRNGWRLGAVPPVHQGRQRWAGASHALMLRMRRCSWHGHREELFVAFFSFRVPQSFKRRSCAAAHTHNGGFKET